MDLYRVVGHIAAISIQQYQSSLQIGPPNTIFGPQNDPKRHISTIAVESAPKPM